MQHQPPKNFSINVNQCRSYSCLSSITYYATDTVSFCRIFLFQFSTQQIEELRKEKENFRVLIVPSYLEIFDKNVKYCVHSAVTWRRKCINPIKSFISRTTSRPSINDLIMCNIYMVKQLLQEILTICNIIQIRDNKISGCKGKALGVCTHT